jgi:hypothetical protein
MLFGQLIIVFVLFVLLRLHAFIPILLLYLIFGGLVAVSALVNLLIPYVSQLHTDSEELLADWKNVAGKNGYLKRKHRALRPIRFCAGLPGVTFFTFHKLTMLEFAMGCMDQVITLMITFPYEYIQELFS